MERSTHANSQNTVTGTHISTAWRRSWRAAGVCSALSPTLARTRMFVSAVTLIACPPSYPR